MVQKSLMYLPSDDYQPLCGSPLLRRTFYVELMPADLFDERYKPAFDSR
jgi:hypothetical protein